MFWDTLRTAHGHAFPLFGTVEQVYYTVAPVFAQLAIEHFGSKRARQIHGTVSSGLHHGQRLNNAIKYP